MRKQSRKVVHGVFSRPFMRKAAGPPGLAGVWFGVAHPPGMGGRIESGCISNAH